MGAHSTKNKANVNIEKYSMAKKAKQFCSTVCFVEKCVAKLFSTKLVANLLFISNSENPSCGLTIKNQNESNAKAVPKKALYLSIFINLLNFWIISLLYSGLLL